MGSSVVFSESGPLLAVVLYSFGVFHEAEERLELQGLEVEPSELGLLKMQVLPLSADKL